LEGGAATGFGSGCVSKVGVERGEIAPARVAADLDPAPSTTSMRISDTPLSKSSAVAVIVEVWGAARYKGS
jgi:hypothetical protein